MQTSNYEQGAAESWEGDNYRYGEREPEWRRGVNWNAVAFRSRNDGGC